MAERAGNMEPPRARGVRRAIVGVLVRTLQPLARLMLQQGMTAYEFNEVARWVFAQTATDEQHFAIRGRNVWRMTKSRAAILTGFTRREVDRLVSIPEPAVEEARANFHRLERVLAAWQTNDGYQDGEGRPRDLPLKGQQSFEALARQGGRDIPVRALLDEAVERGCVERLQRDAVRFVHARTGGPDLAVDELERLGRLAGNFMSLLEQRANGNAPRDALQEIAAGPLQSEHHEALQEKIADTVHAFLFAVQEQLTSHPKSLMKDNSDNAIIGVYNGFV